MVFNDFVVTNVSEREALGFPGTWKVNVFLSEGEPSSLTLNETDSGSSYYLLREGGYNQKIEL